MHKEIVERHVVGAQELIRPCDGLNECVSLVYHDVPFLHTSHRLLFRAFEDAYVLLSNSGTIPQAPEHIPALDADRFKNSVVTIKQLIELIRALEVLLVRGYSICCGGANHTNVRRLGLACDPHSRRSVERRAQGRPRRRGRHFQRPWLASSQREPADAPVRGGDGAGAGGGGRRQHAPRSAGHTEGTRRGAPRSAPSSLAREPEDQGGAGQYREADASAAP